MRGPERWTVDRLGQELSDAAWRDAYDRAQKKLRHIVALYGDADGARNTVEYIAKLAIEAIQADILARWTAAMYNTKNDEGPAQRPTPRGHTNIIPQGNTKSQAVFV